MFSRKDQLIKKTGETGIGRYEFLRQLIHEFTTTRSAEAKQQTLANLANFTYDPINYEYMKQLHLIDLFLRQLSETNEQLLHFALAGLCNLSCDAEIREYIISLNGINLVCSYLLHKNEEISLNALTTVFYLLETKNAAIPTDLEHKLIQYEASSNPRLRNLGKVFSQAFFSGTKHYNIGDQVSISRKITKEMITDFIRISGDTNPIHSCECRERAIVHGALLNSIVSAVIGTKLPGPGAVVIKQTLNFPNKCFVGDTVNATVKLVENRKIITVEFHCETENENKTVLYGNAKLIMTDIKNLS